MSLLTASLRTYEAADVRLYVYAGPCPRLAPPSRVPNVHTHDCPLCGCRRSTTVMSNACAASVTSGALDPADKTLTLAAV
jgi:hypothetical protein